eukprot:7487141-Pyramimonas_sp.AAC.1
MSARSSSYLLLNCSGIDLRSRSFTQRLLSVHMHRASASTPQARPARLLGGPPQASNLPCAVQSHQ